MLDPFDQAKCDRWKDYGGGPAVLLGNYKVWVVWRNGEMAVRDMDVDSLDRDKQGLSHFIVKP
jgi:hypothetical protein